MNPPSPNIFRFKTETYRSMHLLSLFEFDNVVTGVHHSPIKALRKVPRSPYKVLDAPVLQDDFYLNLVDSSKVTKLCDLGIDDSVCSIGWAQRGTHLAVGTSNGEVQQQAKKNRRGPRSRNSQYRRVIFYRRTCRK
ncbi:hypothetical protein C1H46_023752 [Malus baccata]|uniref:Anaphase-promoting complex subunit 4 WD40 domain-containing protein n=1 Tax=Malus baccata TaxID=106549 RepID=A0A540LWJ7_MALBA|nr:hypothetical protein C1H46_023752 [Malus baccata]